MRNVTEPAEAPPKIAVKSSAGPQIKTIEGSTAGQPKLEGQK